LLMVSYDPALIPSQRHLAYDRGEAMFP
jgi:hypothetical protein